MTGGQRRYTMALSHYEQVPPPLQHQLANDFKARHKQAEED